MGRQRIAPNCAELRQNCVRIAHLGLQQFLVDVRASVVDPRQMLLGVELRRAVAHLAEEPLRAAAERARVVEVDVVVLT